MQDEQLPFQFEGTYSIEGYVSPMNYEEASLQLRGQRVQVSGPGMFRGFGVWEDDDPGPAKYEDRYSIMVCGLEIHGERYGGAYSDKNEIRQDDDRFTVAAKIANQWLERKSNKEKHPEAWAYLCDNAEKLNQSKRYWLARMHLAEIAEEEAKIAKLQARVQRGKLVAQLKAYEVISGKALVGEDRKRKWAEISGGLPYEGDA